MEQQKVENALNHLERLGAIRLNKPGGDYYQMYCPFHNNGQERKPSFGVLLRDQLRNGRYTEAGFAHCFTCGYAHDFGTFVKDVCKDHSINPEMYDDLNEIVSGVSSRVSDSLIPDTLMTSVLNAYAVEDLRLRTLGKRSYVTEEELARYRFTVPYMYQRRLTDAVIEKYDVGFDGNHIPPGRKKALPCVTFPVRDISGHTLFICRRSIEGKYFNLPADVEKPVYGIYELEPGTKEVIICESIFNALTCVVYGRPAVALLGTGTSYQMNQLKRLGVQSFVICMDNDEAGHKGTARIRRALRTSALVWSMTVPEGKDVNDLDKEEFEQCYEDRE